MGSSGSGKFTDYPGTTKSKDSGGKGGSGGGSAPGDRCAKAFSVTLEDVEHCEYYKHHSSSPDIGTVVHVARKKRVVAQTDSGEVVGNLPTSLNYLAGCLEDGYSYVGKVRESSDGPPVAVVGIDFAAVPPK